MGLLASLEKHRDTRLVLAPVPRVDEEAFIPALPKECLDIEISAQRAVHLKKISIGPRELARLAIEHMHPGQKDKMFLDKMPAAAQPTTIFRKHGDSLIANCFHMHPVLFFPLKEWEIHGGIDGEGVEEIRDDQTHIMTDSDEGLVVDLCAPAYDWNGNWSSTEVDLYKWAQMNTNAKHRRTFQHDCYIHSGGLIRAESDSKIDTLKADMLRLQTHIW